MKNNQNDMAMEKYTKIIQSECISDFEKPFLEFDGKSASIILAYVSPYVDFTDTVARLSAQAGEIPVIAVSTAGELCEASSAPGNLYREAQEQRQSVVAQSFSRQLISAVSVHAVPLHNDDIRGKAPPISRGERLKRIRSELAELTVPFIIDSADTIALTFIDGVSACESYFMEAVYQSGRFPCLFIGGSAGGKFDFRSTLIYDGKTVLENHAVVVFLKLATDKRFSVLKSQNFRRTEKSFVVLKADPDRRTISTVVDPDTLAVLSAPAAMAQVLGCDLEELHQRLENHTFGIDLDGEIYIRSVAGIDLGKSVVSFYCDVNAGDRLYLLDKIDFITQTRTDYQEFLKGKPHPVAGILNDCILRRLNNGGQLGQINGLWGCPVAGFSTFGELFGININQTLSGLFFFDVPDGTKFHDSFMEKFPVHYGRFVNYFTSCRLSRVDLLNRLRTRTSHHLVDQFAEMDNGSEEIDSLAVQARMEKALRFSQRRLEAITSSLFDGVLLIDSHGLVTFANPAARQFLGIEEQSTPRLDDLVRLFIDGQAASFETAVVERAIALHQPLSDDDAIVQTTGGEKISVRYAVAPIRQDQELEGVVISFRSIEALKSAQKEAEQASRLASVGQLAAGIAHEINTPIQYVGDNLRFILKSLDQVSALFEHIRDLIASKRLSPEDEREAREIFTRHDLEYLLGELPIATSQSLEGTEHVAGIIRSMREFSHPGTTTKTVTDINRALQSTVTISRNEWKQVANLELDLAADLPPVECFASDINQVFLNLIVNAAQALSEIHAPLNTQGLIRISSSLNDNAVEVRISDNGPGVPDELRQRIFDPFFTTKAVGKGTGQGLALCLNTVVNKHGGRLFLEETKGGGATFVVCLPINGSLFSAGGGI
ncbi:MAG TPA: FIST N-terminal domain-containing protein [Candidatus Sulfotelmatobacter sp.]|jgi:PAS domain S-box-containing protein|nr:FIST N-terminal domain-containing protein [Candidatus Sulfotelmatobacter sp.]